jgi:arginine/lysine/ornithine decarboxylase
MKSRVEYLSNNPIKMHTPGHKGRCLAEIINTVIDLTEVEGLDNLHYPTGAIHRSQEETAALFGSGKTYYLINGATAGILASLISISMTLGEGKIIVPRNIHRSVVSGMILSGLEPEFIVPEYDHKSHSYLPLTADKLQNRLDAPEIKAVLVINPTYYGISVDLREIVALCNKHGKPLIVDEAHGAHYRFSGGRYSTSIESGAHVVIHGLHKTSQALTQTGLLHVGIYTLREYPGFAGKLEEALRMVQSSSPSYILLSSIESAVAKMAENNGQWVKKGLELGRMLYEGLREMDIVAGRLDAGKFSYDESRVFADSTGLGLTGPRLKELIWRTGRVVPELAALNGVLLLVTGNDDLEMISKVIQAFKAVYDSKELHGTERVLINRPPVCSAVTTMKTACYSPHIQVSLRESVGKISADTVFLYPPGIPLICPGERIDECIVEYIDYVDKRGLTVTGRAFDSGEGELKIFCVDC